VHIQSAVINGSCYGIVQPKAWKKNEALYLKKKIAQKYQE
jgi:hypothetical protein